MKKLTTLALLVGALTFAACGGNKQQTPAADAATETVATEGVQQEETAAQTAITAIAEKVKAGDAESVSTLINDAKAHIDELLKADKKAEAYAYAQQLKDYVAENKAALDALKVDGTTTAAQVIETATNLPDDVKEAAKTAYESAKSQVETAAQTAGEQVKDAAETAAENAKQQVEDAAKEKVDEAKQAVSDAKQKASDAVQEKVDEGAKKASEEVNKGINKLSNGLKKGLGQ